MPAKNHEWVKFYTRIWLTDPMLRRCKADSRGILADLMCLAEDGTPCGFLTNSGVPLAETDLRKACQESYQKLRKCLGDLYAHRRINHVTISKLHALSFAWPTDDPLILWASRSLSEIVGPCNDPIIFIPRAVRDGVKHLMGVKFGSLGGNPELLKGLTQEVNPKEGGGVNPEEEVEKNQRKRGDNPQDGRLGPGGPGVRQEEENVRKPDPEGAVSKLSAILHGVFDRKDKPPKSGPVKGAGNS